VHVALQIHDHDLSTLLLSRDFETDTSRLGPREPGLYTYQLLVPGSILVPGDYSIGAYVGQSSWSAPGRLVDLSMPGRVIHRADHACSFELVDNGSVQAKMGFGWGGKLAVPLEWEEVECVTRELLGG
jgi:hypothetical protein